MASEDPPAEDSNTNEPDAFLKFYETRHGDIVAWGWSDGRRTVTPKEHDAAEEYTEVAENRDLSNSESGDVVAHIWMDNEEVADIEWCIDE